MDIPRCLVFVVVPFAAGVAGCQAPADDLGGRIDQALERGMRALVRAQSPDGAWRSPTYGVFRDGLTLTPVVAKAVVFGPEIEGVAAARNRAGVYLAGCVRPDGSIDAGPSGMTYPVYTAAAAVIVLSRLDIPGGRPARNAWLRELMRRQLAEDRGWTSSDPAYGAWGYAIEPPIRSDDGSNTAIDADLSSTLFALGALRMAGLDSSEPSIRKALNFLERCQNLPKDDSAAELPFDDGGFFFSPSDPVRNKAGSAGKDFRGRIRYHSYGSATADGLRALLRCGLAPDHPRVAAARRWLEAHFTATTNPGTFEPIREDERDATYYYGAWSIAHAFRALNLQTIQAGRRDIDWARSLAEELLRRQRSDGTWINRFTAAKEDDPLVATSFAVGALAISRTLLNPVRERDSDSRRPPDVRRLTPLEPDPPQR